MTDDDEFDQAWVLGSIGAAQSIVKNVIATADFVEDDPDLSARLAHIIHKLGEFHEAVLLPPAARRVDDLASTPMSHPPKLEPWQRGGRDMISVQESAENLSDVINEVILGANIMIAKHGKPVARLTPVGPHKPFDVAAVRDCLQFLPPHDVSAADLTRQMRNRDRY